MERLDSSKHESRLYGQFASTRLELSRSQLVISRKFDPERRFWFGKFELYIALITIMERWYSETRGLGTPLAHITSQMPCSHSKARGLIDHAVELGYLQFASTAQDQDQRVKVLTPTIETIQI